MMKEKYVVDRVEERFIILNHFENNSEIVIDKSKFKYDFKNGDIVFVCFDNCGLITDIVCDEKGTRLKKSEMKKKLKSLFDY